MMRCLNYQQIISESATPAIFSKQVHIRARFQEEFETAFHMTLRQLSRNCLTAQGYD